MEVKPVPKPRSIIGDRPVPAPRKHLHVPSPPLSLDPRRSQSPSESLKSEPSSVEDPKSRSSSSSESKQSLTNSEFFKNLGTSSRQFKDDISEKMTVKGKAVISSTRNASIRLEKSVKSLLTRRLTTLNQDDDSQVDGNKISKDNEQEDRCVSMPVCNDIFSTLSFYSPMHTNLKSMKNEEDLSSGSRYSPPPPIYPPPPLPDESIYDELQSVASGQSSRYDTLSSTSMSEQAFERDFPEADSFNLSNFVNNRGSDSDQSLNLSDVNVTNTEKQQPQVQQDGTDSRRLSRSDSWTFYDTTPTKGGINETLNDELDRISSAEEESEAPIKERISCVSNISQLSLQNSLYENWTPRQSMSEDALKNNRKQSKSLLVEFDPYAKTEENIYGNYENNDLMLLETLLATSESPSSEGSMADLREAEEEDQEDEGGEVKDLGEVGHSGIPLWPPAPPKRFDSLPKNEYDEVEMVETPEKHTKNPALLPKLAHLARRKQPAVPPRKPAVDVPRETGKSSNPEAVKSAQASVALVTTGGKIGEERRTSVMQRLMRIGHDSTVYVKPNVMNFMKNSKLLSRNRDQGESSGKKRNGEMKRPEFEGQLNPATHRGIVYRSGVGIERAKDLVMRAAVLADQKICFYADKSMTTVKEVIHLETVHSVHLLQDVK